MAGAVFFLQAISMQNSTVLLDPEGAANFWSVFNESTGAMRRPGHT
jgi:hypothetical protein